jgi:Protein of unknown function (DUF4058)
MPIHDWTRVNHGIFHHFHHEWISTISRALNGGVLPPGYYALAEQVDGSVRPDVVTWERPGTGPAPAREAAEGGSRCGGIDLASTPPRVRFTASAELDTYARKRNRVAVRDDSDHRVVAFVEIVSPGNKASRHALRSFVEKAVELLDAGIHLLILDLFPPGPRDPNGIHAAVWSEIVEDDFRLPAGQPLTLVSYSAGDVKQAFIQPAAVGEALPDMALFFEARRYVPVPLEATYQAAFAAVPPYWRDVLNSPPG